MGMSRTATRKLLVALAGGALLAGVTASAASAQLPSTTDPRANLAPGLDNAGVASRGMNLLATRSKPPVHTSAPDDVFGIAQANSDMALQGNYAFVGNFNGFTIYDISNPAAPALVTAVVCPGGQGDLSVYGNLLFMSVEETRAKKDCTLTPAATNATRFRGVRIFDISNISAPVQVGGVQTCRGSHTHTLVEGKDSPDTVYIYVSGTSGTIGQTDDLTTCDPGPATNPNPSQWRIEVIRVPLAQPQNAAIVSRAATVPQRDDRRGRRPAERSADPAHPSGIGLGSGAGHELVPRHHGVRGARSGRRLLRGQRPADRHLEPGQPSADRRRRRSDLRVLARRDLLQ